MATFAIGDIHGCSRALDALLESVSPQRGDVVVTLGDYVDRGPDSRGVIERLIGLSGQVELRALRGNHEIMMLEARDDPRAQCVWLCNGGTQTLESYGGSLENVPARHWEFLEFGCRSLWESAEHFFVHAGVVPELPLSRQPAWAVFWERFERPAPHASGKVMVCGHTSQASGIPTNLGHAICLDTGASGGGWLSCLHLESGRVWQARQSGERRLRWLPDAAST